MTQPPRLSVDGTSPDDAAAPDTEPPGDAPVAAPASSPNTVAASGTDVAQDTHIDVAGEVRTNTDGDGGAAQDVHAAGGGEPAAHGAAPTPPQESARSPWAPPSTPTPSIGVGFAADGEPGPAPTRSVSADPTQPLPSGSTPPYPTGHGATAQFPTTELPAGYPHPAPAAPYSTGAQDAVAPTAFWPPAGQPGSHHATPQLPAGQHPGMQAPDTYGVVTSDGASSAPGSYITRPDAHDPHAAGYGAAPPADPTLQAAAPGTRRSALSRRLLTFAALMMAATLAGYVGHRLHAPEHAAVGIPQNAIPVNPEGQSRPPESVAGIAAQVLPSVIAIETRSASGQSGTGSGFVIRDDGHILTNNHVVADVSTPDEIEVVYEDGSRGRARLVGRSVSYDLAVLKVDRDDLTALPMGNSDDAVVGDSVIAVGAPLGFQSTVTTGIVSAKNRPVSAMRDGTDQAFINGIQTDAAINPGNSGGPLLNAAGQVIGVNSAIAHLPSAQESSGGSIGLGFAIPSNQAARTASQLIESGKATYPIVGVLLDTDYRGEGVRIVAEPQDGQAPVTAGSPADRAGVKPGDVVTHFNGRPISDANELIVAIRAQQQGDEVTWTVVSGGNEREVSMVLDQTKVDD